MDNITNEARQWLGTPFVHQGRSKGIGCDCLGLITGVLTNLNICLKGQAINTIDEYNYSSLPDGFKLQAKLSTYFNEVRTDELIAGDIILVRFVKEPQHLAFISEYKGRQNMIHAYMQAGKVVEHGLDQLWRKRIVAAYRVAEQG